MLKLIESISFGSGALIVAVLSFFASMAVAVIQRTRWIPVLLVPFVITNLLYWSPVMLGAPSYEYAAWAAAFIIPWFIAGAISAAIAIYVRQVFLKKSHG